MCVGMQIGRQVGMYVCLYVCRYVDRQVGRQAGRQVGRQVGRYVCILYMQCLCYVYALLFYAMFLLYLCYIYAMTSPLYPRLGCLNTMKSPFLLEVEIQANKRTYLYNNIYFIHYIYIYLVVVIIYIQLYIHSITKHYLWLVYF